ncbi:MAG: AEC family transporter [Planctomycetales bacterium]|nr:AEC family transporter [Planctomycetales bacterium]
MLNVLLTTLPIFLLILLGWCFKRSPLLHESGWVALERVTYYVLFPCLLTTTLAEAQFGQFDIGAVAGAIGIAFTLISGLLLLVRAWISFDGPSFTSVFQGCLRMNTYIGLSIASTLYGSEGIAAAALVMAIIVPLVNVACVLVLAWFGTAAGGGIKGVVDACLKNPLILASFLGIALNYLGWGVIPLLTPMAHILGRAALPLGLLAVGAALSFRAAGAAGAIVAVTSAVKLLILPFATFAILQLLKAQGVETSIAVLFTGLPTATSSYILASQYGGDARLMASIISVQTLLSMVCLPLVITYLM